MKIIKPTFEILTQLDGEAILKHIEMGVLAINLRLLLQMILTKDLWKTS